MDVLSAFSVMRSDAPGKVNTTVTRPLKKLFFLGGAGFSDTTLKDYSASKAAQLETHMGLVSHNHTYILEKNLCCNIVKPNREEKN